MNSNIRSFLALIFLGFCLPEKITSSVNRSCNSDDLNALQAFLGDMDSSIGHGWSGNSSDCCSWEGVTCESIENFSKLSVRVVALELADRRLRGKLSDSFSGLRFLRILNLSQNLFRDSIPLQLFQLQKLEVLDLSSNNFSGSLPPMTALPSLRYLNLSANPLAGSVDSGLCRSSRYLETIDFTYNKLSGEIPSGFGNCSSLRYLSFESNFLTGELPRDLFQLPKLTQLSLHHNMLSGSLVTELGNLSNLVNLDISFNNFSGSLPNVFHNLKRIEQFSIASNKFSGSLPPTLSNCPTLLVLNLQGNSITGPISLNCSAMVHLSSLNLGSNQFSGPILDNIASCQRLSIVNLSKLKINTQIPDGFKELNYLTQLSLSNTSLHNLSAALQILQHCPNLTTLVLTNNFHDEVMDAQENLDFKSLQILVIANCRLMGSIPNWLRGCTKLLFLDLSWNHLAGAIPSWFSTFKFLFYLDLSKNLLSGSMPTSLTQLYTLRYTNISSKESPIDFPFYSQRLQYIRITSFRPTMNLSYNMLTGPIWPEFGTLKMLHVFDLHSNNLSGQIPSSLSDMINLEALDFSDNDLSGSIPVSLVKLNFLARFSVAYNQLSGKIPRGGQFNTFPDSSFEGNKDLCDPLSTHCGTKSPSDTSELNSDSEESGDEELSIVDLPFDFGAATGGEAPDFVNFNKIKRLDLSNNLLSGNMPISLTEHQSLIYLKVSSKEPSLEFPLELLRA
ncbi:Leucine-rich repeat-containing N-terminal, plant-type [Dillenia turbinata]|uniref:Leucine-rich repeat-containing N-terminal, plant-type n=1 Tax=Dillenia turbinata TaxID=194707 RepID=A0AAN8VB70_9MAGN